MAPNVKPLRAARTAATRPAVTPAAKARSSTASSNSASNDVYCLRELLQDIPTSPRCVSRYSTPSQPSERIYEERIGETTIKIRVYSNETKRRGFLFINLHRNEKTSIRSARRVVDEIGGTIIYLIHPGGRLIKFALRGKSYTFDPNRIFTDQGIEQTLLRYSGKAPAEAKASVRQFAQTLLDKYIIDRRLVIAVHNNRKGSRFSIKAFINGEYQHDAKNLSEGNPRNPHDLFLVTKKADYQRLSNYNLNVVLLKPRSTDDGSLSFFYGQQKKRYINSEVIIGNERRQARMLKMVADHVLIQERKLDALATLEKMGAARILDLGFALSDDDSLVGAAAFQVLKRRGSSALPLISKALTSQDPIEIAYPLKQASLRDKMTRRLFMYRRMLIGAYWLLASQLNPSQAATEAQAIRKKLGLLYTTYAFIPSVPPLVYAGVADRLTKEDAAKEAVALRDMIENPHKAVDVQLTDIYVPFLFKRGLITKEQLSANDSIEIYFSKGSINHHIIRVLKNPSMKRSWNGRGYYATVQVGNKARILEALFTDGGRRFVNASLAGFYIEGREHLATLLRGAAIDAYANLAELNILSVAEARAGARVLRSLLDDPARLPRVIGAANNNDAKYISDAYRAVVAHLSLEDRQKEALHIDPYRHKKKYLGGYSYVGLANVMHRALNLDGRNPVYHKTVPPPLFEEE